MSQAEFEKNFRIIVERIFNNWQNLRLAVEHGMGGHNAHKIAIEIMDYTYKYCIGNKDITQGELQEVIEELMDQEFNTLCDDNSIPEICKNLLRYKNLCLEGKYVEIESELSQLPNGKEWLRPDVKIIYTPIADEDSSSSEENDDSDGMDCDDSDNNLPQSNGCTTRSQHRKMQQESFVEPEEGWTTALDLLERRIDSLSRVIGVDQDPHPNRTENITDSLLSTNTLLEDSLKNRENTTKVLGRATELEKYLEPDFIEESQEVRTKEVYLNAITPDLLAQCEQLNRVKELEPTLGAEYFRNIPIEGIEKLKKLTSENEEFSQQNDMFEESLILALKRYGEIQNNILSSLDQMNKRLEMVEERVIKKKRDEMLKDVSNDTQN